MDIEPRCALTILRLLAQRALRMAVGPIEQFHIYRLGKEHPEPVLVDPANLALHSAIALLDDADQRERLQAALHFRSHAMGRQVGHNGRAAATILKLDLDIGPPVNAFFPLVRGRWFRGSIKVKTVHVSNDGRIGGDLTAWGQKKGRRFADVH